MAYRQVLVLVSPFASNEASTELDSLHSRILVIDSLGGRQEDDVKHVRKWLIHLAGNLGLSRSLKITSIPTKVGTYPNQHLS